MKEVREGDILRHRETGLVGKAVGFDGAYVRIKATTGTCFTGALCEFAPGEQEEDAFDQLCREMQEGIAKWIRPTKR